MQAQMNPPVPSLTGLRFFAAMAIVINHLGPVQFNVDTGVPYLWNFQRLALVGMSLFFTLSGFIIQYNYGDRLASLTIRALWGFFVARFTRLYPLYIALIALDLLCTNLYLASQPADRTAYQALLWSYIFPIQSWSFQHIDWHPVAFAFRYSIVTWSISTEFFLYLIFPAIAFYLAKITRIRTAIVHAASVFLLSSLAIYLLRSNYPAINALARDVLNINPVPATVPSSMFADWLAYISPYGRIPEFLTGCAVAHLFTKLAPPSRSEGKFGFVALVLALVYVGCGLSSDAMKALPFSETVYWLGMFPAMPVIIFCCARYSSFVADVLSNAKIVALGDASYSIYMLHLIVIQAFAPPPGTASTTTNLIILNLRSAMVIGTILVVSLGVYRYIEVPAQNILRKILLAGRGRKSGAVSAVAELPYKGRA